MTHRSIYIVIYSILAIACAISTSPSPTRHPYIDVYSTPTVTRDIDTALDALADTHSHERYRHPSPNTSMPTPTAQRWPIDIHLITTADRHPSTIAIES